MFRYLAIAALLFLPYTANAAGQGAVNPPQKSEKKSKPSKIADKIVPLSDVISEVEKALDAYQQDEDVAERNVLPPLASADFDFKTAVDTKGGFGVNFFVFKIGASVDKQTTNDVDFQYVPKSLIRGVVAERTRSLQQELVETIKSAARAVKAQNETPSTAQDPLVLKQLSVTVCFGVTVDANAGVSVPIQLVTLTASLDRSKNSAQQVKLTFAQPTKPTKP